MDKIDKNITDNKLVELSKANPDAFGELVLRYQEKMFRFIKRISYFEDEDAEDIIQEVFIKVYKNLNAFDTSLKFSTWIYQIARNATIDAIRKKQVRPQLARLQDSDFINIFKSSIDIQRQNEMNDHLDQIKVVISNLPMKYREVVILKFIEEKSYDEIVDIVKKPKGTIASLINRARNIIKEEAEKQGIIINQ